jgi:hypothetical protein
MIPLIGFLPIAATSFDASRFKRSAAWCRCLFWADFTTNTSAYEFPIGTTISWRHISFACSISPK